jgi:hypothetical protein
MNAQLGLEVNPDNPLTNFEFASGFVARLIAKGRTAVEPQSSRDREGFFRVFQFVKDEVELLRRANRRDDRWYEGLVDVRNALKPSNNGAFDGFERLLRDLQVAMTAAPNPYYEQIALTVSRPFAESLLESLSKPKREFVEKAAEVFLQER